MWVVQSQHRKRKNEIVGIEFMINFYILFVALFCCLKASVTFQFSYINQK